MRRTAETYKIYHAWPEKWVGMYWKFFKEGGIFKKFLDWTLVLRNEHLHLALKKLL